MKILIYGMNYAPEIVGIGKYTSEMAEWLAGKGHELRVIASYPYYPSGRIPDGYPHSWYQKQDLNNVTVLRCPIWVSQKGSVVARVIHLLSFAVSSFPVVVCQSLFWRPKVVIVVAPNVLCAFGGWLAARMCGASAILHFQDLEIEIAFGTKMIRAGRIYRMVCWIERWMLRRFDRVSAIVEGMVRCLRRKGIDAEKLYCFSNWVDAARIFPMQETSSYRKAWNIPSDVRVVLYSGSMGKKHGLEQVIEAARLLVNDERIRFVFCGDGSERRHLEEQSRDLRNCVFCELQSPQQVNDLLNLADIHLLVQRPEVEDFLFPSKLLGVFASGRPVVAGAQVSGSLARVAQEGGIVVPLDDVRAFADAIRHLAEDDKERIRLGEKARAYAVLHWDKEKILAGFERFLTEIV